MVQRVSSGIPIESYVASFICIGGPQFLSPVVAILVVLKFFTTTRLKEVKRGRRKNCSNILCLCWMTPAAHSTFRTGIRPPTYPSRVLKIVRERESSFKAFLGLANFTAYCRNDFMNSFSSAIIKSITIRK